MGRLLYGKMISIYIIGLFLHIGHLCIRQPGKLLQQGMSAFERIFRYDTCLPIGYFPPDVDLVRNKYGTTTGQGFDNGYTEILLMAGKHERSCPVKSRP